MSNPPRILTDTTDASTPITALKDARPSSDDCSGETAPVKSSTIPINLSIRQGVISKYINDNEVQLSALNLRQEKVVRKAFELPFFMTKADFEVQLDQQIHSYFNLDVTTYRKDHGGTGPPKQINCMIDVEVCGREDRMTTLSNVLNKETWEAAKGLMRVAKGDTEIRVIFAVQKGTLFERLLVSLFLTG